MTDCVKKTKLTELEDKTPDDSSLATSVSSLVKKTIHDTKISELEKNLLIMIMTSILLLQSLIL